MLAGAGWDGLAPTGTASAWGAVVANVLVIVGWEGPATAGTSSLSGAVAAGVSAGISTAGGVGG